MAWMTQRRELRPETPLISNAEVDDANGRVLRAKLIGDLTVVNAPELLEALRMLIERADAQRVVLSFDDVGYVDSGALGALIEVRKTMGKRGGEVVLDHMPKELAGLIRIMKLDAVFQLGSVLPGLGEAGAGDGSAEGSGGGGDSGCGGGCGGGGD